MVESATTGTTLTPRRSVTVKRLPTAVRMVKPMQAKALNRDESYRPRRRRALADLSTLIAPDRLGRSNSGPIPLDRLRFQSKSIYLPRRSPLSALRPPPSSNVTRVPPSRSISRAASRHVSRAWCFGGWAERYLHRSGARV